MSPIILVIDDHPLQQRLVECTIRQLGYQTITANGANCGSQLMFSALQQQPDLIIIDLADSYKDMLYAVRQVKANKPHMPVIVLTPYGCDDHASLAIAAGANDFLAKPVSVERLKLSLQHVLKIHHMSNRIAQLESMFALKGAHTVDAPAFFDMQGKIKKLRAIENEVIRFALKHAEGSMTKAARNLGIGRSTLYRKIDEMTAGAYMPRANQTTRPIITASAGKVS